MTSVLSIVNILVLFAIALMQWKKERGMLKLAFWPTLIFKLACGLGLGLLYSYYYVGDTFTYFDDGVALADLARNNFKTYCSFLWQGDESYAIWNQLSSQQPRALFLSKISSVLSLLTGDNYWVVSVYFSMTSFFGAWGLVKAIERLNKDLVFVSILSFLLFPSVVFWTSGLIKESLAMASLFFIVSIFVRIWMRERVGMMLWVLLLFALWMLWNLKYYYLAVLLPVLSAALVMRLLVLPRMKVKQQSLKLLVWGVVFLVPLYVASLVHPNFYPERFLHVIVDNYESFMALSSPEDAIHYNSLQANVWSVVYHAPKALISGFFRPFLWEASNVFQLLLAIENLILVALLISSIPRWKEIFSGGNSLLILSVLVYVVLLCVFLALSTPNFGTLVRYRVGFLPFFVLLTCINNPFVLRLEHFIQRSFRTLVQE